MQRTSSRVITSSWSAASAASAASSASGSSSAAATTSSSSTVASSSASPSAQRYHHRLASTSRLSIPVVAPSSLQRQLPKLTGIRQCQPPTSSRRPFSTSSAQRAEPADEFESLYSTRYHGQGARSSVPPWYKSPPLLLLGFMPLFTLGLGIWQVRRLDWKLGLIEELEWKLRKEAIELPKNVNLEVLPSFEYRLVNVAGYFDHSRTMFLGPRVRDGVMGYHIVTPLKRDGGGGDVLIDRGFVSEVAIATKEHVFVLGNGEEVAPTGHVLLSCLLPRINPPNMFTPVNEPERNRWYHADPVAMAEYASSSSRGGKMVLGHGKGDDNEETDTYTPSAGVGESVKKMLNLSSDPTTHDVLPIFLEEIFEGRDGSLRVDKGIPVGRAPTIELRNQHAVYAATWFSLSAATAAMFLLLLRTRGRRSLRYTGELGDLKRRRSGGGPL